MSSAGDDSNTVHLQCDVPLFSLFFKIGVPAEVVVRCKKEILVSKSSAASWGGRMPPSGSCWDVVMRRVGHHQGSRLHSYHSLLHLIGSSRNLVVGACHPILVRVEGLHDVPGEMPD